MSRVTIVLVAVAGVVVLVFAVAKVFSRPIGAAMVERAASRNIGLSALDDLEDGLHVAVCGSGSPMPDIARAGPCLYVVAGEQVMLVDAGAAGARRLAVMQLPLGELDRVFLTHLHSDHFDGLGEVLLQAWVTVGRREPLPIHGPDGVGRVVGGFNEAYAIDAGYRTAHHGDAVAPPSGYGGDARPFAIEEDGETVVFEEGELRVTAFRVDHAPVAPAVGYRFDYAGRSVVVSGDTAYSDDLVAAAEGADVLFHDALQPDFVAAMQEAAEKQGATRIAKILYDIPDYHASPTDAARAAQAAGVDRLVLYHLVPPMPSDYLEAAFLGDAGSAFDGPITVSEDGLLVSLPAQSDEIRVRQLF